jgi:hypothetical protein
MKVKYLKDDNGFQKKGEILELSEPLAKELIRQCIAEEVKEEVNDKKDKK